MLHRLSCRTRSKHPCPRSVPRRNPNRELEYVARHKIGNRVFACQRKIIEDERIVAYAACEHIGRFPPVSRSFQPAADGVGGIGAREGVVAEAAIEHHLARPGDLAAGRKADIGTADETMSINVADNDLRMVEAILRSDFYSFIQAIFPLVSPNSPLLRNWHLEAMAYYLTRVLNGEIRRLIITVPPRSLKSICASVAFPAFALGYRPELRFICASYAENLAHAHSRSCRDVMRSPLYHRLFPHTKIVPGQDNQKEFPTTRGGYRMATSVGGTLTGRGGNFAIIDDPMKAQDTFSEPGRGTVLEWFGHTLLSRLDNKAEELNCGGDAAASCR